MKLNFWEKFNKFFGFGYLVNLGNNEIHKLESKHANCHTNLISNKQYVTKKEALFMLKGKYDGCRFCWKEKNKD
jgi:hypothetical protein